MAVSSFDLSVPALARKPPGYIETDLNREAFQSEKFKTWLADRAPMRRPGTREEVARFVASLFSDDVPFMTGETIYLDGGQAMAI